MEVHILSLGESVSEAFVRKWLMQVGDRVARDKPLAELETDKVTLEVNAPSAGLLLEVLAQPGETVQVGASQGQISSGAAGMGAAPAKGTRASNVVGAVNGLKTDKARSDTHASEPIFYEEVDGANLGLERAPIAGEVTLSAILNAPADASSEIVALIREPVRVEDAGRATRVRMMRLRQTTARRLKDAQNNAAVLTTFSEANMPGVMTLCIRVKDLFEKAHGPRALCWICEAHS